MIPVVKSFIFVTALAAILATTGCVDPITSEVAKAAWEDRLAEDQIVDAKIKFGIVGRLTDRDKSLILDISTDVWEQRVMLTGVLDSPEERIAVLKLAREDKRIKVLHNEIQIVTPVEKEQRRKQAENKDSEEKSGFGQAISDFWIETKIKAKLLTASGVTSVNYRWRSVLNKLYIIGRAGSADELEKVLDIVRQTEGTKSVTHFIQIKPS